MKEISDDIYVSSPLPIFPPVEISPVEILRNNRGERENFFIVQRLKKKSKRGERRRKERERREVEEFGGRESLKRRMGYLREFNEIVGKN